MIQILTGLVLEELRVNDVLILAHFVANQPPVMRTVGFVKHRNDKGVIIQAFDPPYGTGHPTECPFDEWEEDDTGFDVIRVGE